MDPTTHRLIAAAGSGQIRDADFKNTVLLLHGDGTNGAQNNTFIDGSTNNFTITRNGNTTQGSFNPYGDRWSNYFDGNGDNLLLPSSSNLALGTGDFTVEFWLFPLTVDSTTRAVFSNRTDAGADSVFVCAYNSANGLYFHTQNTAVLNSGDAPVANTWQHVAFVRSSGTLKIYLNGVEVGSVSASQNLSSTAAFYIGKDGTKTVGAASDIDGYISNLRVVKGTAVYTAAFTPSTTPLTAITNTSLLTCQSNRFVDNSATPLTITRNGDVRVTNFNPFGLANPYSTSNDGGSGYFDTSGDLLSVSNAAFDFGSGDFTIEMWVYCLSASPTLFRIGSVTDQTSGVMIYQGGLYVSSNNSTWNLFFNTAVNIPANCFTHIAFVRNGSAWNFYRNGVSVASTTASVTMSGTSAGARIGGAGSGGSETAQYFSDVRVVKGTAVYTGAFTPPTLKPLAASGADSAACYSSTTNVNTTFAGSNTSLLLNFTNAGIYDQTEQNVLETVGNAQISTTQKKFGTGALYFDGTGDYLTIPDSPAFDFGSGNFTIELWVNFSAAPASTNIHLVAQSVTAFDTNVSWSFLRHDSNKLRFISTPSGGITNITIVDSTNNFSPTTGIWYHIAAVRNSGVIKLYVDGSEVGSGNNSSTFYNSTRPIGIGASSTGEGTLNGYIDDLRITKGVARYTAAFTPPAAPFPDF